MDVTGTAALVTGAARRVGRGIALALAEAGCDVAVHYHRSASEAEAVVEQIRRLGRRAAAIEGNLADRDVPGWVVEETVRQLGRLDVLVNNASVFDAGAVEEWTTEQWERTFQVNTIAPAMLARAAAAHMRHAGRGRIINLADILAERPIRRFAAYCASKAALVSLTRSLARELAPTITVNAVAPGIAIFPEHYDQTLREELVGRVPLQRAGTPEEIAAVVRFLVTTGDYITGQVIAVDGGRSVVP
ncbi:MAG: SDR family oxidoreductase [Planctomycetes bacterium]|nr:SDR family oxidoreductase [Planctomycetota bacterium]